MFWLSLAWLLAGTVFAEEPVVYKLDNGLKVILLENHRAPVASMLVWVKAGSSAEGEGEYGLAHLMEHMLFKGTDRRGPGEIAREVEASGGRINAYTSYDQTVYYIDMAGRFARKGLDILADMVFHPSLAPEEFAREKEVVVEEIKMGEDNPDNKQSRALFAESFKVHPYGRPIIGFSDTVRGVSRETAVDFHQRWYKPGNMVLVVAGDLDPVEMKSWIKEYFGEVPDGEVPEQTRAAEPGQKEPRMAILREDVNAAQLSLGYHTTDFKSGETPAVDLLSYILGDGRTSRLYRNVKSDRQLVHAIQAGSYTPRDPGLLVINAQLAPDLAEAAVKAIVAEATELTRREVTPQELSRAKLNTAAWFIKSRDTMSGEAKTAAQFEALAGDYRAKDEYLSALEKVTSGDIKAAAAKYLVPDNLSLVLMLPKEARPDLGVAQIKAAATEGAAGPDQAATASATTAPQEFKLAGGGRLIVKADHSLPLVAVRAAFLGGLLYEDEGTNGLNNLMAEVWDRGTTRLSADELARAVEDMAATISSFSGRNSFGVEGQFLSQYLDPGLDLLAEVMTKPAFDPREVEKARPTILAALQRQQDQLPSRTFRLFTETLFAGHPYSRDILGRPETIQKITAADLKTYYDKWAVPGNLVITVVGDVEPERIKNRLNELLAGWSGQSAVPPVPSAPETWQGLRRKVDRVDKSQAHLVLGFLAPGLASPDRYALEVLDAVLSGMGGRLFLELRDKQSLAYSVSSFYNPGLATGSFGFYIGFDPAKLDQARAGFNQIIEDVRNHPVTDLELANAKEYLLGQYEIGLQTYEAQAAELTFNVLYELGLDYGWRYEEGLSKVTAEQVQQAARKYLNPDQAAEVLVGAVEQ
jgi:zinc protease